MTNLCTNCGTDNGEENAYCGTCGAPLHSDEISAIPPEEISEPVTSSPSISRPGFPKRTRNIVIAVDTIVIIVIIVVALMTTKGASQTVTQSQTLNILSSSFTVDQGGYGYYPFSVPEGATSAQVTGNFAVTNNVGSGIRVYVMDSVNLFVWANSHGEANVTTYYKSGEVMSGTIKFLISSGTYYLIFDNTASSNPKDVQANVSLAYN